MEILREEIEFGKTVRTAELCGGFPEANPMVFARPVDSFITHVTKALLRSTKSSHSETIHTIASPPHSEGHNT
jgi:hypothetical protein